MSQVRGKNTRPERLARSLLHHLGYRFTVNGPKNKKLPGRPDIVLPRYRTVVFIHGCFWHRHPGCSLASTPKSNQEYWQKKFAANTARDQRNCQELQTTGWQVLVVWECELKDLDALAARLVTALPRSGSDELPEEIEDEQLVAETRSTYGRKRP